MENTEFKHIDLSEKIIRAYYNVFNKLGYGFLEKIYENALLIELQKMGIAAFSQYDIKVYYDDIEVGSYKADIVVENKIILELKASESLKEEHEAQLLNYLRATKYEVGILLNFGKKPEIKRKLFTNSRK